MIVDKKKVLDVSDLKAMLSDKIRKLEHFKSRSTCTVPYVWSCVVCYAHTYHSMTQ